MYVCMYVCMCVCVGVWVYDNKGVFDIYILSADYINKKVCLSMYVNTVWVCYHLCVLE